MHTDTITIDSALDRLTRANQLGLIDTMTCKTGMQDVMLNGSGVLKKYLDGQETLDVREPGNNAPHNETGRIIVSPPSLVDPIDMDSSNLGFMMRALITTTLPHVDLGETHEFVRRNGRTKLIMHLPMELIKEGFRLPFGPIPRLILLWITSEVYRTKEPILHLGGSQSEFMRRVNLTPIFGPKGNFGSFHDQLVNLFATSYTAVEKDGAGMLKGLNIHHQPLGSASFWWDDGDRILKDATITLNPEFHRAILESAIPVDLNVVNKLKGSSMKLDLFWWLSWRLSYLDKPTDIKWSSLQDQFGTTIKGTRQVRQAILRALKSVADVFPIAGDHVREVDQGIRLEPVRQSVAKTYSRRAITNTN